MTTLLAAAVREHNTALLRYLHQWTHSRQDAQDLVQEAYAHILARTDIADVAHLRGYLFKTAQHLACDWQRRRSCFDKALQHQMRNVSEMDSRTPEGSLLAAEELLAVERALTALPARTQQVLGLIREQGLSYAEVAAQLGIKTNSVCKLVRRAMEILNAVR
jgi:RNA polymerase sigma factor (sigma-70 family)